MPDGYQQSNFTEDTFCEQIQPGLVMVAMRGMKESEALRIPKLQLSTNTEAFSEPCETGTG